MLRYFTAEGDLVLSPEEAATQAETRAERLVEQMRLLGIKPEL